ncbi:M48 family metalloprotease [Rufibacter psychrotolerans]|uniref:M48 family metalloprotease n=1 Tax=Rufibacter psychrotolerans TaxID=2812556 RepID=UPI001967D1B5|nr:M48 family metalloprotease [Rufibacter sp. SYSU D00308]
MRNNLLPALANRCKRAYLPLLFLGGSLLAGCSSDKNGDRVLFSIENDLQLGQQVAQQMDSTYRAKGQLLDRNSPNPRTRAAYAHLDQVVNRILESDQVSYREEFAWDVKIIDDPNVQNAFATPGGHIYVFTGLIRFLDSEDQLAGVLGHEIAHADQRHSVKQLQKQYGISFISRLVLGESAGQLERLIGGAAGQYLGLKFSRDYEREADEYSVLYLGATNYYACDGAAGFFQKMQTLQNSGTIPEFFSTHPAPGNRIHDIQAHAQQRGCQTTSASNTGYQEFKRNLGL